MDGLECDKCKFFFTRGQETLGKTVTCVGRCSLVYFSVFKWSPKIQTPKFSKRVLTTSLNMFLIIFITVV